MENDRSRTVFGPEDTLNERLAKAARVEPSPQQLRWMDKEMTAFLHFGPNTFTGRQWGTGTETTADYAPTALDPEQWVRVCAEAGLKHIVCTFKHHDGFCLWHTRSTDFSVEHSAYPADVARAVSEACRKYGVGFGVYLSPWDMHQREAGIWPADAYNDLFLVQLEELLTNYGPVEELWFDGACGNYPIWQKVPCYRTEQWYELIHRLQPQAVYRMYDPYFFADEAGWQRLKEGGGALHWSGKAVRWVGNEEGRSRADEWSVQPVFMPAIAQNAVWPDLGSVRYYEEAVGAVWYPVEVNTTILNQWFHDPETSKLKSLAQLKETYYQSVGNGGVLLLNLSPDRTGRIPQEQVSRLMELRRFVDDTFRTNLASDAAITVDNGMSAPNSRPEALLTEDETECWEGKPDWDIDRDAVSFEITLPQARTFDQVMLREDIRHGQRVAEWSVCVWENGAFREVVRKGAAGRKCIRRFGAVCTHRLRLTIRRSHAAPMLCGFGLYLSRDAGSADGDAVIDLTSFAKHDLPDAGLTYKLFEGGRQSARFDADAEVPIEAGTMEAIRPELLSRDADYHAVLSGVMRIPKAGEYRIDLTSADGALFFVGDRLCADNDEPHALRTVTARVRLSEGDYPFRLFYTAFREKAAFAVRVMGEDGSELLL